MRQSIKLVALLICLILASQTFAVDTSSFGINIPNIQDLSPAEQAGPKSWGDLAMESPIDVNSYRLGPGDQLALHIIIGDSELTVDHNFILGADGKIFFPNVGEIYLSGLSLTEAKRTIDRKINHIFKENYTLSILLNQPKKVKIYLSGMVKSPGPLAVFDNSRISEVLAQAGGVASGASNRYVYIKRKDINGKEIILAADLFEAYRSRDLDKDIRIQSGDIIEVPDAMNERISSLNKRGENDKLLFEGKETFVYVYGEVARSGRFEYVSGKKLSDYISYAGGPTAKALLGSVSLTRQDEGRPKKYQIDVSDVIYNGNSKNDIEVLGGDVINIPGNFFYVVDFASFANTVILALTLFNTFAR